MPASSKSQQRLFSMIAAYQSGKLKGKPSPQVKQMSHDISSTAVGHFAKTKHRGLPERVKQASLPKQADAGWAPVMAGMVPGAMMGGLLGTTQPSQTPEERKRKQILGLLAGGGIGGLAGQLAGHSGYSAGVQDSDERMRMLLASLRGQ